MSATLDAHQRRVWQDEPARFVRELFEVTPDGWQDEVLAAFPTRPRLAMKACRGPGKAAVLATPEVKENPRQTGRRAELDRSEDLRRSDGSRNCDKCHSGEGGRNADK